MTYNFELVLNNLIWKQVCTSNNTFCTQQNKNINPVTEYGNLSIQKACIRRDISW